VIKTSQAQRVVHELILIDIQLELYKLTQLDTGLHFF